MPRWGGCIRVLTLNWGGVGGCDSRINLSCVLTVGGNTDVGWFGRAKVLDLGSGRN